MTNKGSLPQFYQLHRKYKDCITSQFLGLEKKLVEHKKEIHEK